MPERWAGDLPRRRAAGIPGRLQFATKPQLAIDQVRRLTAAGLPARWVAAEETFKTGKDVLGWDQSQVRTWDGICRHTTLAALAQLRQAAIRNALCGTIHLAPADAGTGDGAAPDVGDDVNDADLRIPLGDA